MKKSFTTLNLPLVIGALLTILVSCNNPTTERSENGTADKTQIANQTPEKASLSQEERIKKGKHLVITLGCDDCHTQKKYHEGMPEPDMDLHMAGFIEGTKLPPYDMATVNAGWTLANEHFTAWVGAWGTSFAANITPDNATGIGNWTEKNFLLAMREGKYHGLEDSRPILPPMPWPAYSHLTDEEMNAMFVYLKSIKPIKNAVPAPLPPKGKRQD
jgi:hypothetical protein